MHLVAILLVLQLPIACVWSENAFSNPPAPGDTGYYDDNNVYALGDLINIRWTTDFEAVNLILWQQSDSSDSVGASIGS